MGNEKQEHSIEILELSPRAYNCLRREGICTVEQLVNTTDNKLMHIRNFGAKSFSEVRLKLSMWLTIYGHTLVNQTPDASATNQTTDAPAIDRNCLAWYLTPSQIAKRLGISYNTVCKMLRNGTIKGTKTGGKWHVSASEVKRIKYKQQKRQGVGENP